MRIDDEEICRVLVMKNGLRQAGGCFDENEGRLAAGSFGGTRIEALCSGYDESGGASPHLHQDAALQVGRE